MDNGERKYYPSTPSKKSKLTTGKPLPRFSSTLQTVNIFLGNANILITKYINIFFTFCKKDLPSW